MGSRIRAGAGASAVLLSKTKHRQEDTEDKRWLGACTSSWEAEKTSGRHFSDYQKILDEVQQHSFKSLLVSLENKGMLRNLCKHTRTKRMSHTHNIKK